MTAQQEMASEKLHFTPVHPYLFHHKEIYEEIEGPSKYFAGVTRQAYYYLDVHGGLRVYVCFRRGEDYHVDRVLAYYTLIGSPESGVRREESGEKSPESRALGLPLAEYGDACEDEWKASLAKVYGEPGAQ